MRKTVFSAALLLVVFACIQFIRPKIDNPPVTAEIEAPIAIKAILRRACYDCHSNETHLRWYDRIQPVYWQVAAHVKEGRKALNFSDWQHMAPADQKAKLWEAVNQVVAGAMPIKDYEMAHPTAKLSKDDVAVLKDYVGAFAVTNQPGDTAALNASMRQQQQLQNTKLATSKLPVALNGISYIPDYASWQVVSTTDRFDNSTLRVIFGNNIAVEAIKNNNIHPWPNGTIFAKVAWDQLEDRSGNVTTGAFKQIEYMIKDDQKYASTKGWGFARFKTLKLVPYGTTPLFATECVNCHRPQKDEDFVFTQPIKN